MANEITRVFGRENAQNLNLANDKTGSVPSVGTKFQLTGNFAVEERSVNGAEKRFYAYFEGQRNGRPSAKGLSGTMFLRRPFGGFPAETALTDFQKRLNDCGNAADLDSLFQSSGVYNGKTIVVKSHAINNEIPYGKDKEAPVRYAIFDLE